MPFGQNGEALLWPSGSLTNAEDRNLPVYSMKNI